MDKEMKIELINNGEEDLKIREYDQSGKESTKSNPLRWNKSLEIVL